MYVMSVLESYSSMYVLSGVFLVVVVVAVVVVVVALL
jgi:hypothetical protein